MNKGKSNQSNISLSIFSNIGFNSIHGLKIALEFFYNIKFDGFLAMSLLSRKH